MNTSALIISDIFIRQDSEGRYCLNDLHKASGSKSKDQPSKWLITQQAIDLIDFIKSEITDTGILVTEQNQPLKIYQGGNGWQGTFVLKPLVYAYAMWISAKFHLAVIRAYDALVTKSVSLPEPLQKTKKALSGCLTAETQDEIKQLIQDRAALQPKDKQAGFVISMWSALGTHFGIKKEKGDKIPAYKRIPEGARLECLSLLARLSVDDLVTMTRDEFDAIKALPAPVKEGELLEKQTHNAVTVTLAPLPEGEDMKRWLITQHGDNMVQLLAVTPDTEVRKRDHFISELRTDGYIVVKKDEVSARKLADDYLPSQMLLPLIEAATQRLQRIENGK